MLKKFRKIRDIIQLQAKARGNSLQNIIGEEFGLDLFEPLITKVFNLEKPGNVTDEEKETAKKTLKEKYNIDTRKQDDRFYGAGLPDKEEKKKRKRNKEDKPLSDIKKTVATMAESVKFISESIKDLQEKNNSILNTLQKRVSNEISSLIPDIKPLDANNSVPYKMEKAESGLILPESGKVDNVESNKETIKETTKETVKQEMGEVAKPTVTEPTAIPAKQETKSQTLTQFVKKILLVKYPDLKYVFDEKDKKEKTEDSNKSDKPSATEVNDINKPSLQPALEGIAQKQSVSSVIEPDELQILLKDALKEAMEEIKRQDPKFFSDGSSGGIVDTIANTVSGLFGGGAAPLTTTAGTATAGAGTATAGAGIATVAAGVLGAAAITGGIAKMFDVSMKSGADKEIRKIIEKGSPSDIATALKSGTPQQQAYKLQEFQKIASDKPELMKKLESAKAITGLFPASQSAVATPTPPISNSQLTPAAASPTTPGTDIIEMNRAIKAGEISTRTPPPPPVVQRITNNTVLPQKTEKENIRIGNSENTFNRLIEQDFNHPSTYSTFNMG